MVLIKKRYFFPIQIQLNIYFDFHLNTKGNMFTVVDKKLNIMINVSKLRN